MAYSPYMPNAVDRGQVTLPNGTVINVPDKLPDIGNQPIPKTPYTGGLAGKTPNDIMDNFRQVGENFKKFPGEVGHYFQENLGQAWNKTKNTMIPVMAIGGGLGLGTVLANWAGGGNISDSVNS